MSLVAAGDSIVHAADSWPAWLARAMGQELRRVSADGARSDDVLEQVATLGEDRYAVACLSVGTNDVLFGTDPGDFRERVGAIVAALRERADRVLVATVTRSLARFPGAGAGVARRVDDVNAVLAGCGATVVQGDDLHGPRLLQADRIHPTREGQLLLADRAAAALGVTPAPSTAAGGAGPVPRWTYHRVGAAQAPRQVLKRVLRRPAYRGPRAG